MRTYSPKTAEITRAWHVVDADGVVLGRLSTAVATLLRGKHKTIFAPHIDTGDHVIVVNAAKVVVSANKADQNFRYRHSGYPGGIKRRSWGELLADDPVELVHAAIKGMVPKNRLGRAQMLKLHVYAGPDHPHQAQQPQPFEVAARVRA